jgi:hypothetical protein
VVPRLCLGTDIQRLCLVDWGEKEEAEPPDLRPQAEPGNEQYNCVKAIDKRDN